MTLGRTQQLRQQRRRRVRGSSCVVLSSLAACIALCSPVFAQAPEGLPTGGNITAGAGSIAQSGASMTVTQSSERMVAEWNGFSVGANASVTFAQPSAQSIALNRVLGADPSSIQGRLSANGRIFLLNPNGVIFGQNSRVDVGGIVASSQSLSNEDFLNGNYRFSNATGGVLNQGTITAAPQGYVVLSGTTASNEGAIDAAEGTAALVAGESMTLEVGSTGLLSVSVDAATLGALAQNTGVIRADGGVVFMLAESASTVPGMVLAAGGTIQAQSITERDGKIYLDGGTRGEVHVIGTLDASAETPASADTSGSTSASAETSVLQGGDVTVLGENIALLADAHVDASGDAGGGTVLIGGNWQGKGPEHNASAVVMDEAATIDASATASGDGGTVVLWSDDYTNFQGSIAARGGAQNGVGGKVETSAKDNLQAFGSVDAAAPSGQAGEWLLDPADVTISAAATSNGAFAGIPSIFTPNNSITTAVANVGTINTALSAGTSVTINTANTGGGGAGDITVSGAILKTGTTGLPVLTLAAVRTILVNSSIGVASGGSLSVVLNANSTGLVAGGYVNVGAPITTNGGNITIGGGTNPLLTNAIGNSVQPDGVIVAAALSAGTGNISIRGTGWGSASSVARGIVSVSPISASGTITLVGVGGGTGASANNFGVQTLDTITGSGGAITITGTAGTSSGTNNQGIRIGALLTNTGAGGITMTGTGGGTSTADNGIGVYLVAAVSSTTGMITITGTGGPGSGNSNMGVRVDTAVTTTGGAISITGTGGAGTNGANHYGVYTFAPLTSNGGNIALDGTGGSGATPNYAYGISSFTTINASGATQGGDITLLGKGGVNSASGDGVDAAAAITTNFGGKITLTGTTHTSDGGVASSGVRIRGAVTAVDGTITVTGSFYAATAGNTTRTTTGGNLVGNVGVLLEGSSAQLKTTGTPTPSVTSIVVNGTGAGGTSTSDYNYGVLWEAVDAIKSTGLISIKGTGGVGSSSRGNGVFSSAPLNLAGAASAIYIEGIGGGGGASTNGVGVRVAALTSTTGDIELKGTGGPGSGGNNIGVWATAAITTTGGAITMRGDGGVGNGGTSYGINLDSSLTSGGGAITLTGNGGTGASATDARGVWSGTLDASGSSQGGAISVIGVGGLNSPSGEAILFTGNVTTNGAGNITIDGTTRSSGANVGAGVKITTAVTAVNGTITVKGKFHPGTGGTTTRTTTATNVIGNVGVLLEGNTGKLTTTGTGSIVVEGTGGGSTAANNFGVLWEAVDAIKSNGLIDIKGTGGPSSGAGNYGVNGAAALTLPGAGSITINGTGGSGNTGGSNYGFSQSGAITTAGGSIIINGTGGIGIGATNYGISLGGALISAGGDITLVGKGGTGVGATFARGILAAATVNASGSGHGGNISLTGTGGPSSLTGWGIDLTAAVTTNGDGNIELIGTSRITDGQLAITGVRIQAVTVSAVNGKITVNGSFSAGSGGDAVRTTTGSNSVGNVGVSIEGGGKLSATGTPTALNAIQVEGTGAGSTGANNHGVFWETADAVKSTGHIYIKGTGGPSSGSSNIGVYVGEALTLAGASSITMDGTGGSGNTGGANYGTYLPAAVSTSGGAIAITGRGGAGIGNVNYGIHQIAALTSAGGNITLDGTGGANAGATAARGYSSSSTSSTVNATGSLAGGNISIIGTGGPNSVSGYGMDVNGAVTTNFGGTITLTGTSHTTGANQAAGVRINNVPITAVNGLIKVSGSFSAGVGGTVTRTTTATNIIGNVGVLIEGTLGALKTTGNGSIEVEGIGGGSTAINNYGVFWETATSLVTGTNGSITLKGTGGGTGSSTNNYGVYAKSALTLAGTGALSIEGIGGSSTGTNNYGIWQTGALTTASGNITLDGKGGAGVGAPNAYGIYSPSTAATITATGGNIKITGVGGPNSPSGYGIDLFGAVTTSLAGTIELDGTSHTTGANLGAGVRINAVAVTAATGTMTVTGKFSAGTLGTTVRSTGIGFQVGNIGVLLEGIGAKLTTTTGNIVVNGTGGAGSTGSYNHGVFWEKADAIKGGGLIDITGKGGSGSGGVNMGVYVPSLAGLTLSGSLKIDGTGGSAGPSNTGVYVIGALTGSGGAINIIGVGGNSSGDNNVGVVQTGVISNTLTGAITIRGTAGGSGITSFGYLLNGGSVTSSGAGDIDITGIGAGQSGTGVFLFAGVVSTLGAGKVDVRGTATSSGANVARGVRNMGTISAENGKITITGELSPGSSGTVTTTTTANNVIGNIGVLVEGVGAQVKTTGTGSIELIGTGGGSTAVNNYGVFWESVTSIVAGSTGSITLRGIGGGTLGSTNNYGVYQTSDLSTTGGGGITIHGTGGAGAGAGGTGYYNTTFGVTAGGGGNIAITGIAGATTRQGYGIQIGAAAISTVQSGTITLTGTGHSALTSYAAGVHLQDSTVSAVDGPITITGDFSGTAGSGFIDSAGNGTLVGNVGVLLDGSAAKVSTSGVTGTGVITLDGTGGLGDGGSNYGVFWEGAPTYGITATSGAISIEGTGGGNGGAGGSNVGVSFSSALIGNGGLISIIGTGGNSSGTANYGVEANGVVSNTGAGGITLFGTGGGTGSNARGFISGSFAVTAVTGDIAITGIGGANASSGSGVATGGGAPISTTGAGKITIVGTARSKLGGSPSTGVNLGDTLSAVNGLISITGDSSGSLTASSANRGVVVGGIVRSTGTGGIYLTGTGGGTGGGLSNHGVYVVPAAGLQTTSAGVSSIEVIGTAGGGTSGLNYGAYLSASTAGTGTISVTGHGGTAGTGNSGIVLSEALTAAGAGPITLAGTGGAGATSDGIAVTGYSITSQGGNVALVGRTTGTGSGVKITGSDKYVSTNGSGTLTLDGIANGGAAQDSYGVSVAASIEVSTAGGALEITGVSNGTNAGFYQAGIYNAGLIKSSGNGDVSISGAGSASTSAGSFGVLNVGAISAVNGALEVFGVGRASGTAGVYSQGSIASTGSGSPITITAAIVGIADALYSDGPIGGSSTSGDITLNANSVGLGGGVRTSGDINILPVTAATSVGIGTSVAGTLHLNPGELSTLVWGDVLKVGGANAAEININNSATFAGRVWFENAAGNINVSGTLTSSAAGDAVVLASGGNFNGGDVSAPNGRYLIYSYTPASNTETALTGAVTRVFVKTIDSYPPASVIETGNVLLYVKAGTLKITAEDKTRDYGDANPTLTYLFECSSACLEPQSLATGPTLTTLATPASNVGDFAITASGAAPTVAFADYDVVYVPAVMTVTARPITVSSTTGQGKAYGVDDPLAARTAYAVTTGSLVNGNTLTGDMGRALGETVSTYAFTQGTTSVSDGNTGVNYTITFNGATNTFAIMPAALTATLANQSKVYGANDPSASGIAPVLGGVINRTIADINGSATVIDDRPNVTTTFATLTRTAGESVVASPYYSISAATFTALGGSAAANYAAPTFTGTPTLQITPATTLTATFANQTKIYGDDDPAFASISGVVTGAINRSVTTWNAPVTVDDSAAASLAATPASITRGAGEIVATYPISAATFTLSGTSAGNYSAPAFTGTPTLSITAKTLTATIANQTKVYGENDPSIPGITPVLTGRVNRSITNWSGSVTVDDSAALSLAVTLATLTRDAGETVAGTPRAITAATFGALSGTSASNYGVPTFTGTPTFSITPALLTATIADQMKVYGADDPALSDITPTLTGAINRAVTTWSGGPVTVDDSAAASLAVTLAALTRNAGETVAGGPRTITAATFGALSGTSAGNYSVPTFSGSPTLGITPALLTATIANQTKVYGVDDPALVDIAPIVTGTINRAVTTWSGGPVTVDDSAAASLAVTLASLGRTAGETVAGGARTITGATFNALSGTSAGNYGVPTFNGTPTLTIAVAPVNATIANQTKIYGADDPLHTGIAVTLSPVNRTVTDFNSNATPIDDRTNVAATLASLTRAAGETVAGSPRLIAAATFGALTGTAASNYAVPTFVATSTLTIDTVPLTATILDQQKAYGFDDPLLSGIGPVLDVINRTVTTWNGGVPVNDTAAVGTTLVSLTRTPGETAGGSYPIGAATFTVLTGSAAANYQAPTFTGTAVLNITQGSLTGTIANPTKVYGADDPLESSIPVTLAPVNRDVVTWNNIVPIDDTGNVSASVTALVRDAGENVGSHNITAATLSTPTGTAAANYSSTATLNGAPTLNITPAALTATIGDPTKVYGDNDPLLSTIVPTIGGAIARTVTTWNGAVGVDDSAAASLAVTLASLARSAGETVGATYPISAAVFNALTGTAAANYAAPTFTVGPTLSITAKPLTATIADQSKIYGDDDPALSTITPTLAGVINRGVIDFNGVTTNIDDTNAVAATLASVTRDVGETVALSPLHVSAATFTALTGGAAPNYSGPTFIGAPILTITQAPISATLSQTKVYGETDPVLSGIAVTLAPVNRTVSTWVGNVLVNDTGNVSASVSGLTRVPGENVGDYDITGSTFSALTGSAAPNYGSPVGGVSKLTITKRGITVAAQTDSRDYDGGVSSTVLPLLTNGTLVNGDTFSGLLQVFDSKNAGARTLAVKPGYTLNDSNGGGNYLVTLTGATGTIAQKALSAAFSVNHKTYDGDATATGTSGPLLGVVAPDDVSASSVTLSFANKIVGTAKAVTASGGILSGADALNYTYTLPTGLTANIIAKVLAVTGATALDKTYDRGTGAVLSGGTLVGLISPDVVTLGGGVGAFANKDVGLNKAVTVSGYTLGGADGGNYLVTQPVGLTASIASASLTITGTVANDRVYNGSAAVVIDPAASLLSGLISGDAVTLTGSASTGTFGNKTVGVAKPVTVAGFTISGTDAANYLLVQPAGVTASVTAKPLPIIGVVALDKIFDGNTTAGLNNAGAGLSGVIGADTLTVLLSTAGSSATFADANAGNGKPVTAIGYTIAGLDAVNYALQQPANLAAYIAPLALGTVGTSIDGTTAANKIYDGTTVASVNTSGSVLTGLVSGSTAVTLVTTGAVGAFDTKDVGTGKTVTITGFTLGGADANNYVVPPAATATANITAMPLDVSGVLGVSREYDRSSVASLATGAAAIGATITGDVVNLVSSGASGAFADKSVGNGKAVTVTGLSLTGAAAGNYSLVQPLGVTANVTPATLTIVGAVANDRDYDATTAATITGGTPSGVIAGDDVSVGTGAGIFDNKLVGANKAIVTSGFALSGADGGNYLVTQPTGLTANVTPKVITLDGVTANDRIYDTTIVATLAGTRTLNGVISGDTATISGHSSAVFGDKNVGTNKAVTVSGFAIAGADATNYSLAAPSGVTASITPAPVTVVGVAATDKVYDATATTALSGGLLSGVLGGDVVDFTVGTGSFSDKQAGAHKPVTASGFAILGADAGNYVLSQPSDILATIARALLTLSGVTALDRSYDATMDVALGGGTLTGVLSGDDVTSGNGSGTFADRNVGVDKEVTVTGYALGGADAANYLFVQPTNLTATMTRAPLTVTASGNSKIFDGDTSSLSNPTSSGLLGNDTASLNQTYDNSDVGTGKMLTPTAIVDDGNDGANYSVTLLVNNDGVITDATLPELPTDAPLDSIYRPITTRTRFGAESEGVIPVLRAAEIARRMLGIVRVTLTDLIPTDNVSALRVRPVAAPVAAAQTPLAPGQIFANTYSDGSASTTTLVQVVPGTMRMRVSETSLNVSEQFALAAGDNAAGTITIIGDGSDLRVSMDASVPAPQGEALPVGIAGAQVGVSMTGSAGHQVEFSVSVDNGLVIQPTGATAAAIFGPQPDGALLNLVMAQAIVAAVTKLNLTDIPAIRLAR